MVRGAKIIRIVQAIRATALKSRRIIRRSRVWEVRVFVCHERHLLMKAIAVRVLIIRVAVIPLRFEALRQLSHAVQLFRQDLRL